MFPIQTFSLLAHVQLINFYGWKVWFFKWPSLQRRSGNKEWPQPAVDSFQLEGTGRLQLPQIWTFWDGFWSTFFYTWTGESTSKGFWENWGIGRTRCSPSLSHLPFSLATWKKSHPIYVVFIQPPSSSSLSDSAKILRIWQPWMTAMIC